MKVLVNAVSISEGGSLVVLERLLAAMIPQGQDIEWHAVVHPAVAARNALPNAVRQWTFPSVAVSPAHLFFWYEVTLPRLARRIGADLVFSQTNYLPRRRLACPTLLLVQHAGHFSHEFSRLMEQHLGTRKSIVAWRRKGAWVRSSVRVASQVIVQTAALARAIRADAWLPAGQIDVVPHGPGVVSVVDQPPAPRAEGPWRVGYVSKFGVQKDFATALRAHRLLLDRGLDVTLVLTLDPTVQGFAAIDRLIDELGTRDRVDNRGEVEMDALQPLYDSLDAFVFPSLCESFGFPLVEAMARALPVTVARTASNLEVGRGDVPSFSPGDSRALADILEPLMRSPALREAQARRSLDVAGRYSWDRAARNTLDVIARTAR